MKKKICSYPSCNVLIDFDNRYCERHIPEKRIPFKNAIRTNESLYNSVKWRKLRKRILLKYNVCQNCGFDNDLEIHHIIPPRGNEETFYNEDNLIPLCKTCHKNITGKELTKRKK